MAVVSCSEWAWQCILLLGIWSHFLWMYTPQGRYTWEFDFLLLTPSSIVGALTHIPVMSVRGFPFWLISPIFDSCLLCLLWATLFPGLYKKEKWHRASNSALVCVCWCSIPQLHCVYQFWWVLIFSVTFPLFYLLGHTEHAYFYSISWLQSDMLVRSPPSPIPHYCPRNSG